MFSLLLLLCALAHPLTAQTGLSTTGLAAGSRGQFGTPLGYAEIFTYFFVMLGPIKLLAPFSHLIRQADTSLCRRLAWQAFWLACLSGVIAAVVGKRLLLSWHVSVISLIFSAGVILFLVALRLLLHQYTPPSPPHGDVAPAPTLATAVSPVIFPWILPPYGTATLIILITLTPTLGGAAIIMGIFLFVMVFDLLAMLYIRQAMHFIGLITLQILGSVLGVLQVALGIELIFFALKQTFFTP